ncbi:MAG: chemotaxis protein CheR [Betaproteobacteria bacterium]|jgi:chemotaxis protein methyltransferase CheR|nr:chemotaxis protein CheR [Betaproteobacteria bacterium]HMV22113.1 CheR family methyltransferase [Rhodocyclaceae bacterium]HNE43540.1 CheR family methyltransferase [Rhodocyclaceae bacterium]HNL20478.1 CheR family methyltransferase [Rhodocyclaceae bacterium]HNM21390.1 CheR family methyltransferase [Rhodocyclaceae bacterium]
MALDDGRSSLGQTAKGLAARECGSREFNFSAADFERVRKLIYAHAGISLSPIKQDMVYSRLARRLRATGKSSFAAYLDALERDGGEEWERFVNSLTTNLTSFFREPHHFPIFADHLKQLGTRRPIRVWCSAASTGEEPYSIAITILETFGSQVSHVSIFASDLDTNVLETARKGVYPVERVEKMDPERLRRFFLRGTGSQEGMVAVRPELKRLIEFQRINLLEPNWPVRGPLDVIFCRNVMIYFDKPTQYKILSRFEPMIEADGLMFAGHSESFLHAADLFRSLGKTVYVPTRGQRGR